MYMRAWNAYEISEKQPLGGAAQVFILFFSILPPFAFRKVLVLFSFFAVFLSVKQNATPGGGEAPVFFFSSFLLSSLESRDTQVYEPEIRALLSLLNRYRGFLQIQGTHRP